MDHPFRGQGGLFLLLLAHYAGHFLTLLAGPAGDAVAGVLLCVTAALVALRVRAMAVACFVAALCGALAAGRAPRVEPASVRPFLSDAVVLEGRVLQVRATDGGWAGTVDDATVSDIRGGGSCRPGTVIFYLRNPDSPVSFPARVRAVGRLRPVRGAGNPGEIPREWTAAAQGAGYAFYADASRAVFLPEDPAAGGVSGFFARGRHRTDDWVRRHAGTSDGALYLLSLATGETPPYSHPMVVLLRRTGLAHLLAISGVNVAVFHLIAVFLLRLALWSVRRRHGTPDLNLLPALLSLPACWGYVLLAGAPVPAVRSAGMITLSVLAWRRFGVRAAGTAWSAMLLLTLVVSPLQILAPSFLLTYGATFYLIANCARPPRHGAPGGWRGKARRWGREAVVASTVAFFGTLPVSAAFFQAVPSGALLWNVLFGPVLGTGGIVGASLAVAGGAFGIDGLGPPVRVAAEGLTKALSALDFLSGSGAGCFPVPPSGVAAPFLAVAASATGTVLFLRRGWKAWPVPVAASVLFLGWLHLPYLALPGREVVLTALNVGKGAAHLVTFPGGGHILIDCGSALRGNDGARAVLPLLRRRGIRKVDVLVLTHPHEDHYGGAEAVLSSIPVGEIWLPDGVPREAFGPAVAAWPGRARAVRAGERAVLGGADVLVRAPRAGGAGSGTNERGIVLELRFGILSVWLPGDVEGGPAAWGRGAAAARERRVLFLPHHGSRGADPAGWVARCRPEAVVAQNSDCFTGENLVLSPQRFLLENGAFTVRSDGRAVFFEQEGRNRGWLFLRRLL
jgi:competence protein ComEC